MSLVFLAGRDAFASPSAKLVYVRGTGADSCPGEAELRKAVALRLGYDPFFPVAQKTVVAQVTRVPQGYRGRVQIVGDDGNVRGERELSTKGDDCTELVGALALAVSIALDDLDEVVKPPPPPATTTTAAPKVDDPPPKPPQPPPPIDKPQPPPRIIEPTPAKAKAQLALSLGPTVSLGTAPDAAAGASLAVGLRWPSIAVRIDARGELPSSKTLPQGGQVATNVVIGTASFCIRGRVPFACVGGGGGALFSSTEGITRPATDRASLVVALARGGANIALSSLLYLEPFAEVGANILARSVEVDGRSVYETSPVWGLAGIHFGAHLL